MGCERRVDTVADLAALTAERVRFEMEHGATGYGAGQQSLQAAAGPAAAPKPIRPAEVPAGSVAPPGDADGTAGLGTGRDAAPTLASGSDMAVSTETARAGAFPGEAEPQGANSALQALRLAIGDCRRCALHAGRTHIVFGEGNPEARLALVGEGPGRDEDQAGRPFVGAAGQLLDRIIGAMGLKREDVYICNVVKCRPPQNRPPDAVEQRICGPFLERQLSVIRPGVVVALGSTAAAYLLNTETPIGQLRGRFHQRDGLLVMPTYHPAYLLRNPGAKREVWQDIQQVMNTLGLERPKG